MKLMWHIVKKDLRRLRLPLTLWVVLLGSQVYISNHLLSFRSIDLGWFNSVGTFSNLLQALGLMVNCILVALLVLDDPLTGTGMFWVTRPIAGGRLLGAKVLSVLLLFGVLPLAIWLPWWLYCSFGLKDLAGAAFNVVCVQALSVLPAFALATLVDQVSRFLLFSLMVVAAVLVIGLNLLSHGWLPPELITTRGVLASVVLLLAVAIVVWRQFHARQTVSSTVVWLIGVGVAAALVLWWPVNLRRYWPERNLPDSGRIIGEFAEFQEFKMTALDRSDGPQNPTLILNLRFKEVPEEVRLSGGFADVELRWPDGTSLRRERLRMELGDYDYPENHTASLRKALNLKPDQESPTAHWDSATKTKRHEEREDYRHRLEKMGRTLRDESLPSTPRFSRLSVRLVLTPELIGRIKNDPPACSIVASIRTQKAEALLEMPLRSDAQASHNGIRLHIVGMGKVSYRRAESLQPTVSYLTTVVAVSPPGMTNDVYLYRMDREHGAMAFLAKQAVFAAAPVAANIECLPFDLQPPQLWRGDKWIETPGWQEEATLLAVTFRETGAFQRNFLTDRLVAQELTPQ